MIIMGQREYQSCDTHHFIERNFLRIENLLYDQAGKISLFTQFENSNINE